jgi:type VI protein secretion system component Hcp
MLQLFPCLPRILLASSIALAAAAAVAEPPSAAPVPMQNPNTSPGDDASARRNYHPLLIVKRIDKASPILFATQSASCATTDAQPVNGVASHPEEGGQVAAADKAASKVSAQSISITHKIDKSSPVLMASTASVGTCH